MKAQLARLAGAALLATVGWNCGTAYAVPSVAATPAQDVYALLAQNAGLAASVPVYTQPQAAGTYSSLTVIGDSWADWGNALQFNPVSSQVGADGRYGNALNIIDALEYHYALPTSAVTNYAFGGATTGSVNNNPPALQLPGMAQEVQSLVSSGRRFGANDLITFTTAGVGGSNDTAVGIDVAQGTANIAGYVNTLVGLGARNILLNAPSDAATASLQAALASYAIQGVNITVFNFGGLITNIVANPIAYGFAADATTTDYCSQFGGSHTCNGGLANRTAAQTTAQILAEDRYLFFYVHPTTALAGLIAQGDAAALAQTVPEPGSLFLLGLGLTTILAGRSARRWLDGLA